MHKRIKIPMFYMPLHFYVGEQGLDKFKKDLSNNGLKDISEQIKDFNSGLHYSNHIWIEDITDRKSLIHEYIHFMDWMMGEHINAETEREFKAYMGAEILEKLLNIQLKEVMKNG